jgi:hypothetical protein
MNSAFLLSLRDCCVIFVCAYVCMCVRVCILVACKRVNVSVCGVRGAYRRFPLFQKRLLTTVTLEAGESLYIPSFYFHHVVAEEPRCARTLFLALTVD